MDSEIAQETSPPPAKIRALAAEVAEHVRRQLGQGVSIWWYGSWVRGTAEPRSDLDIAVDAGEPIPGHVMQAVRERLDGIRTLHELDLVDLRAVGPRLQGIVRDEGVAL